MGENRLEKGEYVIGIAVILAALLISATLYIGVGGIQKAIDGIKLTAGSGTGTAANATGPSVPTLSGLDFSASPYQGSANGNVMIIEYSDFQCPYCQKVVSTMEQVVSGYSNAKFIFRQFPLSFHQYAQKAAEASLCAGAQGKFWEMHDKMYENQNSLSASDLKGYAAALGMNATAFNSCLDSGEMAGQVAAEGAEGAGIGISGTPGFLVYAKADKSAALKAKLDTVATQLKALGAQATVVEVDGAGVGIVFAGALPYANFQQVMNAFQ